MSAPRFEPLDEAPDGSGGEALGAPLLEPLTETPTEISALRLDNDRRMTRAIFVTLLVTVSVLVVADLIFVSGGWAARTPVLLIRALMASVLLFGLFGVVRAKKRKAFEHRLFVTTAAAVLIELVLRLLRPPESITPVWLEIVLVLGCYAILPNRPLFQAIVAMTLTVGTSVILIGYNTGVSTADRVGIILTLVIANAVGIVASRERVARQRIEEEGWRRERDAHLALQRAHSEIRVLRGMLPVCAHCHRIRTEDGAWQEMERYVAEHSEAQFSHGFCPSCMAEHYPA
jgi:uncharacterized membrane protein YiaA